MALMNCAECSKEISAEAISCPHCGVPTASGRAAKTRQFAILIGAAGIVCGTIAVFTPYKILFAAVALGLGIISLLKKQRLAGVFSLCLVAFAGYQIVQINRFVAQEQRVEAQDARARAAKADINMVVSALKLYKLDNQRYPTTEQGLQALVAKPTTGLNATEWKGAYLDKIPTDPWGNPYHYQSPGAHGEIDVFSLGADSKPGGTGEDADIGSWN
jgi:general secretion pathway protein G